VLESIIDYHLDSQTDLGSRKICGVSQVDFEGIFRKIIMIDWKDISEILCPREIKLCAFGYFVKDILYVAAMQPGILGCLLGYYLFFGVTV